MNPKAVTCGLFAWVLGFSLVMSLPLRAQVSGATLSGTVTDAQGGNVPNAKVSARNVATGIASETVTNGSGLYTVPNLSPGDYDVSVSAVGFSTAVAKVTLAVGAKQEMNIPLAVGQVEQSVQVTTEVPQIDTTSSTVSGEVNSTTVRELPLNGRDWASLATLEPGVASVRSQFNPTINPSAAGGRGLGLQLTISGSRPTQNSYRLDGAIVNDYSNSGPASVLGSNLGVDAIQEFTVLTSNYSAEYGYTSGGVINAVTKSGTNTFHGTAFDFVRNDKFDAANFFNNSAGLPKNPLKQNQFGAAAGWRILKDKLFFFGDYEGVRYAKSLPHTGDTTLTPAVTQNGTVVNLITGSSVTVPVDPIIKKFLGFYPAPTPGFSTVGGLGCLPLNSKQFSAPGVAGGCNPNVAKFIWQGPQAASENFYTFRGDAKISDKDSMFVTYLHDYSNSNIPLNSDVNNTHFFTIRQDIIAEETHVFNPFLANAFRVAFIRTINFSGESTAVNPLAADPSLAMIQGQTYFAPAITLTGAGVTTPAVGQNYAAPLRHSWGILFQVHDDAFVTKGTHGLKFGFSFIPEQTNAFHIAGGNGSATFTFGGTYPVLGGSTSVPTAAEGNTGAGGACYQGSGSKTSQNSYDQTCGTLVNFLTNQPRSSTEPLDLSTGPKQYFRSKIYGVYIQDDWRIHPSLTLNLGLRYEMSTIPTEIHDHVYEMPSLFTQLPCGPLVTSAPGLCPQAGNAASVTGDPLGSLRRTVFTQNPTLLNFEPRLGFAWSPFHNGKTAIRGGFGVFDSLPLPYLLVFNATSTIPFTNAAAAVGPGVNLSPNEQAGALAHPGPPPGPPIPDQFPFNIAAITAALPPAVTTARSVNYVEPAPHRNYVYQYNFNIQRQITPSMTFLVGYAGSRGLHNPFQADSSNTVLPTKAPGGFYYWPGCFGPASVTAAGQAACITAGTTWSGNLPGNTAALRLLNPSVNNIMTTMWQSSSWYNGLSVKLDKRLSRGFQMRGSFTWSRSIDTSSGSATGDTFGTDYTTEPWYDLSLDKGLSDFNVRRNLVINGVWNAPSPKNLGAFGDKALGGWQLGLITELSDGVPFWPSISADMLGEVIGTVNPPNVVVGCSAQKLVDPNYRHNLNYVNAACLSLVQMTAANASVCDQRLGAGTCSNIRGNLGRNTIVGPGLFNVDFSVFKNTPVPKFSEAFNVQFRAEFFNVLNHTNFAPTGSFAAFSSTGVPISTFSQLTATQTQNRIVQLALKLVW